MKLIEVAMPLESINRESRREKSIRHGHPSTLHLWWARRPLAACRAVLFAQLVDDPSAWPDRFPTAEDQEAERKRLFSIIELLVPWEHTKDEQIMHIARQEIARSIAWGRSDEVPQSPEQVNRYLRQHGPHIRDPFCGGGSIPLEAQRLGLPATGSDLNPVAVLISKATCEIPACFNGLPPVSAQRASEFSLDRSWTRATGLASDIEYYANRMREAAWQRIGHLYPKIRVTDEMAATRTDLQPLVGDELTVIAWIWARTVASPDPSLRGLHVPLVRSFDLSTKKGQSAWIEPVVHGDGFGYDFVVNTGGPKPSQRGTVNRQGGRCLVSGVAMPFPYIRAEGQAGRIGSRLMAVVAEGNRRRVFLPPTPAMEALAREAKPTWKPEGTMPERALGFRVQEYGMLKHSDLFTDRQLVALTTFSDLVAEVREEVLGDALAAGMSGDQTPLSDGGRGATAYADAVATYLALGIDKAADYWSAICSWHSSGLKVRNTFARQAIPMIWDYCEGNPFSGSSGNWLHCCRWISKVVGVLPARSDTRVRQADAAVPLLTGQEVFATDPPYFDNIGYADLSDYFYVWLRRSLRLVHPSLFGTMQVPKADEMIASPHRHGGREGARKFFMQRMREALAGFAQTSNPDYPSSIFYAYKQTETDHEGTVSTGWASFLQAAVDAGFAITGTWPIRTELTNRPVAKGANALASSVVLACRRRNCDAPIATRGQFLAQLRRELPVAVETLRASAIAPVDLAQAAVGQGMRVFTQYTAVLESDDSSMQVRTALQLINAVLDESLETQDVEYDQHTRFALAWFESYGMEEHMYGEAETLGIAKDVEVNSMSKSILMSQGGKVRLLRPEEIAEIEPEDSIWKCVHRIIWLNNQQGEGEAASSMALLPERKQDTIKEITYRLYRICENNSWAALGLNYNSLIASWKGIRDQANMESEGQQPLLIEA